MENILNDIKDLAQDYNCSEETIGKIVSCGTDTLEKIVQVYYELALRTNQIRLIKFLVDIYNKKACHFGSVYEILTNGETRENAEHKIKPFVGSITAQFLVNSVSTCELDIIGSFSQMGAKGLKNIIEIFVLLYNLGELAYDLLDEVCELKDLDVGVLVK